MRKLIICVPDEMAALVREWKMWIPEMNIVQDETCDDLPKRVKKGRMDKVENTDAHPEMYMSDTERFIQLSDIAFALKDFYGESTAVSYLSKKLRSQEAEVLFNTLLGLLKRYGKV